jgi:hypothetical protein
LRDNLDIDTSRDDRATATGPRNSTKPFGCFTREGIEAISAGLRAEIGRLEDTCERLTQLAAGDHLALPPSVVGYLDRLRDLGVDKDYIGLERDAWIMIAAQLPHEIDAIIADKQKALDDPDMVLLYSLLGDVLVWDPDDPRVVELADLLERMMARSLDEGTGGDDCFDDRFVELLDTTMVETSAVAARLMVILQERGWKGWTRVERIEPEPARQSDPTTPATA